MMLDDTANGVQERELVVMTVKAVDACGQV
jgi:hypothetical protein